MEKRPKDIISFPMHLSGELERLFDEMIHRPWGFSREIRGWDPSIDLYETDDAFILEADLPGVTAEDVKLELEDDHLTLTGSRSLEKKQSGGRFHSIERVSGEFVRHIHLPESVQKDAMEIDFSNGVLRITLPKLNRHTGESI